MLNAHRALELACAAGGALEDRFLRVVFAEQRFFRRDSELVLIPAQAKNDLFGVEQLAGVGSRAMLAASAALHAGVGLQADDLSKILAGDQAEVFVARKRRNGAEAAAREKDRRRAQHQVQVLGVRNERQK